MSLFRSAFRQVTASTSSAIPATRSFVPPIPTGPSSSRWASTYVHLGDLANNKGATKTVSPEFLLRYAILGCKDRYADQITRFDSPRMSVSVEVPHRRKEELRVEVTKVKNLEQETESPKLDSREVRRPSRDYFQREDSSICELDGMSIALDSCRS